MTLVLLQSICAMHKPTGGRSYGYVSATDSASGNREIDPDQAKIVREIFELTTQGFRPGASPPNFIYSIPFKDLRQNLSSGDAFSRSSASAGPTFMPPCDRCC
jgi:hypothetical protein